MHSISQVKSLIYISGGNLPSKWAHSIQIAKMSQAYAHHLGDNFALTTSGDIFSFFKGMDTAFQNWYGLHQRFNLVRLPTHFRVSEEFPPDYSSRIYERLATSYALLKSPSILKTRSPKIALQLLEHGLPVIFEWHEIVKPENKLLARILGHQNLVGVIALSPYLKQNFIDMGAEPKKIFVAPSGVDLQSFQPDRTRAEARKKLSIHQEKIILYSGHLYDYKGIPTILELAQLLPSCSFLLIGGWEQDINRVRQICDKNSLTNVHLIGHVSQEALIDYLYAADIFILPTSVRWELSSVTSPLKLFDYMAAKRPIVSSDLPTIETILQDGKNALIAKSDNADSFKTAILRLLENPNLAESIAEEAYRNVQKYSWNDRAQRILDFINQQLEAEPRAQLNLLKRLTRSARLFIS